METETVKRELREKIAGEITMSPEPGKTIRKWRESFGINQHDLSVHLKTSPSVISDYESGRRRSPGIVTVKHVVEALIEIDLERGGKVLGRYNMTSRCEAILGIAEFNRVLPAKAIVDALDATVLTKSPSLSKAVYGYTVVDSMLAIKTMSSFDYLKIYGWCSERAIVFTGVKYGRSAMVAIRTHPLRPALVIYSRPEQVDELAVKLAELEDIPLLTTKLSPVQVLEALKGLEESEAPAEAERHARARR